MIRPEYFYVFAIEVSLFALALGVIAAVKAIRRARWMPDDFEN